MTSLRRINLTTLVLLCTTLALPLFAKAVPAIGFGYPPNPDELNRQAVASGRVTGPQVTDPTYGAMRPLRASTYDTLGRLISVSAGRTDTSGTNPASDVVSFQQSYAYDD